MNLRKLITSRRVKQNEAGECTDKTIALNRVAKVVKGGRRFSFSALVVSGDGKASVGIGLGKAGEVPDAMRKASESARNNLVKIPLKGTTIPHDIMVKFGPTKVLLKPAAPGTGVIAGSVVRAVVEAVGITDIRTKVIGSSNAHHVVYATLMGLLSLREPHAVAGKRGKSLEEVGYQPF